MVFFSIAILMFALIINFINTPIQSVNALIKDNPTNPKKTDFKITSFGIDSHGNPFLKVKGEAGRTVPGDNDAFVELLYEFFTNKGTYVAASDGGKYAALNTFKNINGERCLDSAKSVGKVITNDHTLKIKGIDVQQNKEGRCSHFRTGR